MVQAVVFELFRIFTLTAHLAVLRSVPRIALQNPVGPCGWLCGSPAWWIGDSRSGSGHKPYFCLHGAALLLPAQSTEYPGTLWPISPVRYFAGVVLIMTYWYSYNQVEPPCLHSGSAIFLLSAFVPISCSWWTACCDRTPYSAHWHARSETSSLEVVACFPCAVSNTDAHSVFKVQRRKDWEQSLPAFHRGQRIVILCEGSARLFIAAQNGQESFSPIWIGVLGIVLHRSRYRPCRWHRTVQTGWVSAYIPDNAAKSFQAP